MEEPVEEEPAEELLLKKNPRKNLLSLLKKRFMNLNQFLILLFTPETEMT
ncbi:MAG: hypothetical protein GH148_06965 [Clostridia bacterium]|jgi:hypothetical protein|nr:hypothetical protein [Clostridia bacterium]